jgi:hypothetical protein
MRLFPQLFPRLYPEGSARVIAGYGVRGSTWRGSKAGGQLRLQLLDQRFAQLQPLGLIGQLPGLRCNDRAEHLDIIGQISSGSAHQCCR